MGRYLTCFYRYLPQYVYNKYLYTAIYMVGLAGYAYGLALLCLFFMLRAQKVFRNTKLRLNKCTKILFIIGLSIQLLTPIGFIFYFLSGWDEYNRTWALRYFNIFTWTNVCSSIGVLIVFIRRILALSKVDNDISQETNTEIDIEKEMKKITTDTQDIEKDLLRMIIRYSVCAIIALFSTLVVVFFGIIRSEVPSFHSDLTMRGLHLGFHVLDCTINLICLSLQFPFGKTMYGKCCGRIDLCVSNCFLKALRLKIKTSEDPVRTYTTTRVDSRTEVSV